MPDEHRRVAFVVAAAVAAGLLAFASVGFASPGARTHATRRPPRCAHKRARHCPRARRMLVRAHRPTSGAVGNTVTTPAASRSSSTTAAPQSPSTSAPAQPAGEPEPKLGPVYDPPGNGNDGCEGTPGQYFYEPGPHEACPCPPGTEVIAQKPNTQPSQGYAEIVLYPGGSSYACPGIELSIYNSTGELIAHESDLPETAIRYFVLPNGEYKAETTVARAPKMNYTTKFTIKNYWMEEVQLQPSGGW
jgi:hypothetical protein